MNKPPFDLKIDIGLVGNSDVGKSSLINKFVYKENIVPGSKQPTIAID